MEGSPKLVISYFDVCFSTIQLLGFVSLVVLCAGRRSHICQWCERVFVLLLLVVSGSAIWALGIADSQWVFACPTLASMVVGATLDLGEHHRRGTF